MTNEALTANTSTGSHLYLAVAALTSVPPLGDFYTKAYDPAWATRIGDVTTQQPFKMLISFHYYRKVDVAEQLARFPTRPMVFADSGAFSAYSQGADVKVADYAAWLKEWEPLFTTYVNLDVIRDPGATATNQRILEGKGLNPIPVVHTGTDLKVLKDMTKDYGYIALGGMVGVPGPTALKWSATCFKTVRDTNTVFHGFGQTRDDVIQALPWFSVDSSSWGMGHRFGRLTLWTGRRFEVCQVGDAKTAYKHAALIRKYGGNPEVIADRAKYDYKQVIPVAANSWRAYEAFLRRKHGSIPLPDRAKHLHEYTPNKTADGLHLHFAEGAIDNLLTAANNTGDQP